MPEIDNNQAAGEGQGQTDIQTVENSQAGADNTATTAGEGAEGGETEGEKAKADDPASSKVDDDGKEPPVRPRLSRQDFIIGRQHKKLEKAAKADDKGADDPGDGGNVDDDEVAPEDEELITKVVNKRFAPIIEKSLAADDDHEVNGFLADNPDFKPYEAKARRYMTHPSRRSLPIEAIFYEVAGKDLIRIGAERERAATVKAQETQTGGGSNRAQEGGKSDWELSKDEFATKQEKIRRGQ